MLIVFDKDGTLVPFYDKRPANTPDEQVLLPGVAKKIAVLKANGHKIAIASNQGGVAWGFISLAQAETLMSDIAAKIGADAWRFCPHDERAAGLFGARQEYACACECRKPRAGMLLSLMREFRAFPFDALYVGDRDEDRNAALAAGVQFAWAQEFFEDT